MGYKKIILLLFVGFAAILLPCFPLSCYSQNIQKDINQNHPRLMVDFKTVNYDTILQHSNTSRQITLTNTGNIPLQVYSVRSSCGISIPSWPRLAIEPGKQGFIQISYNSSHPGPINRRLIIHSNSPENSKIIKIKGYVMPTE